MISNFSLRQRLHLLLELLYGECDARMRQEIKGACVPLSAVACLVVINVSGGGGGGVINLCRCG